MKYRINRRTGDKISEIGLGSAYMCEAEMGEAVRALRAAYDGGINYYDLGAGNSKAPMIFMLASFVAFRQIYLFGMSNIWNEIIPIAMSYPAGWLLCSILTGVYYHKVRLGKSRLVEDVESK